MAKAIRLGVKQKVFVTTVTSDGQFFVQLDTPDAYSLPDLSKQIAHLVQNNPGIGRGFFPTPGGHCCALSLSDDTWYRALVIKSDSETNCTVYYIDYGNIECSVPLSRLLPPLPDFFKMSYQAIQCQLANFVPNKGMEKSKLTQALSDNILNQELPAVFMSKASDLYTTLTHFNVPCYITKLFWEDSDDQYTVTDELVAMELGTYPSQDTLVSTTTKHETATEASPKSQATPTTNDYQYLSLEVGQSYKVYISYAESPAVVWCQLADHTHEFEAMVFQLQNHMTTRGSILITEDPGLSSPLAYNQPCCVLYEVDGNWCRGAIQEVNMAAGIASVLFVDFGNTETLSLSAIYSLPSSFFSLPAQAISFSMYGIAPSEEVWSPDAIVRFEELYDNQELTCQVKGLDDDGYPAVCLKDAALGCDLAQVLIEERYAINLKSSVSKSGGSGHSTSNQGTPERDTEVKSKHLKKHSFIELNIPKGKPIPVTVVFINSLDEFYCQLLDQSDQLTKLMHLINQHCSSSSTQPIDYTLRGLPVLSEFSEDKTWYRAAMIPPQGPDNQWGVLYVDYGNRELVNIHKLLSIPEGFLHLPMQSFQCSLDGVSDVYAKDDSVIESFSEMVTDQEVECVIKKVINPANKEGVKKYVIQLFKNGVDILSNLKSMFPTTNPPNPLPTQSKYPSPAQSMSTKQSSSTGQPHLATKPTSVIPSMSVPTDKDMTIVVCFIESPNNFSCQLIDNSSAIDFLVSQMCQYYQNSATSINPINPVIGAFCAALFSQDHQWYRAKIIKVFSNQQVEVIFVDYGNSEVISLSATRELTSEFFSLPNQAVQCTLDGLVPELGSNSEVAEIFAEMCLDNIFQARFAVSTAGLDTPPIPCRLFDSQADQLVSKMLTSKFQSRSKNAGIIYQGTNSNERHQTPPSYNNTRKSPKSSDSSNRSSPRSQKSKENRKPSRDSRMSPRQDGMRISPQSNKSSSKGASPGNKGQSPIRKDHTSSNKGQSPNNKGQSFLKRPKDSIIDWFCPSFNTAVAGFVSCVISPAQFFVQPLLHRQQLKELKNSMFQYYSQESSKREPYHSPIVKTYCSARGCSDICYYRCLITEIIGNIQVKIFCVDYGYIFVVPVEEIFILDKQFMSLPAQAIECSLSGFGCELGDAFSDSISEMQHTILEQEVEVTFLNHLHDNKYEVNIVLRQNLSDLLISKSISNKTSKRSSDVVTPPASLSPSTSKTTSTRSSRQSSMTTPTAPPILLLPGQEEQASITAVSPTCQLFCQLFSKENQLEEITTAIDNIMATPPSSNFKMSDLQRGLYVLSQFTVDNCWYRAKILDILENLVEVFYIDFGNQETLSPSRICPIPSSVLTYPSQAVRCQLESVESYKPSPGAFEALEAEVVGAVCTLKVLRCEPNGKHFVNMTLTEDSRDIGQWAFNVGLFLCSKSNSISSLPTIFSPDHTSSTQDSTKVQLLSDPKNDTGYPGNITTNLSGSGLKPYIVKEGEALSVFISYEEENCNVKTFWLQPAGQSVELEAMSERLEETYDNVTADLVLSSPQAGQACCAKYSLDNLWYRAIVLGPRTSQGVPVFFVDYGNQEVVSAVYKLEDEFYTLPMLALPCQLESSSSVPSTTDQEEPVILHVLFLNKQPDSDNWLIRTARPSLVDAQMPSPFPRPPSPISEIAVPMLQLKPGDKHEVYIVNSELPTLFWCQLVNQNEDLEELMALIADFYTDNTLEVVVEVESYCVAQYSKNRTWYRAKILEVKSPDEIQVLFIDYGNQETLSFDKVLGLEQQFAHLPAQAFPCSLLSSASGRFTEDQLETFFSLNIEEESFYVSLQSQLSSGEWHVLLQDQHSDCINDMFLSPLATPTSVAVTTAATPTYYTPRYPCGSRVDVFVTCVNSPDQFYCQPLGLASQLEELMSDISTYIAENPPQESVPMTSLVTGQSCLAHYTSNSDWYRGQIEDIDITNNQVSVRYIDYGNLALLGQEQITFLPHQFLQIPTQALRCSVIKGLGQNTWSPEINDAFLRTLREEEQYTLVVLSSDNSKYIVEVYSGDIKLDFSFLNQVQPNTDEDTMTLPFLLSLDKDIKEDYTMYTGDFAGSTLVYKSSKSPTTDLDESEGESANTGEPLIHAPCKLSLVRDEVVDVNVVHVQDPSLVYLQRIDCKTELEALFTEIEMYCSDCADKLHQQTYHPGDFVLAQYALDNYWYRARVLEATPEGSLQVQFIDYGNLETVSPKEMVMCPGNYLELPIQAIPCSLAQVPSRENWPEKYKEIINELVDGRCLQARVAIAGSHGMPPTVTLLDLESDVDIGQKVLEFLQEECEAGVVEALAGMSDQDVIFEVDDKQKTSNGEDGIKTQEKEKEENLLEEDYLSDKETEVVKAKDSGIVGKKMNGFELVDQRGSDAKLLEEEVKDVELVRVVMENIKEEEVIVNKNKEMITNEKEVVITNEEEVVTNEDVITNEEEVVTDDEKVKVVSDEEVADIQEIGSEENVIFTGEAQQNEALELVQTAEVSKGNQESHKLTEVEKEGLKIVIVDTERNTEDKTNESDQIKLETNLTLEREQIELGEVETLTCLKTKTQEGKLATLEVIDPQTPPPVTPLCAPDSRTLHIGSHHKVHIVNITSPYDFVCHLTLDAEILDAMMSILSQKYEGTKSEDYLLTHPPETGDIVCALYSNDDNYYRAKVLSIIEDAQFEVEYIDYGNQEALPLSSLYQLDMDLSTTYFPPFALKCSLSGLPESFNSSSHFVDDLVTTMLEHITGDDPSIIEIIKYQEDTKACYDVKLIGGDGVCVNDVVMEMIKQYLNEDDNEDNIQDSIMTNENTNILTKEDGDSLQDKSELVHSNHCGKLQTTNILEEQT